MKILFVASLMFLVGCATPYQKDGWRGGYSESQVNRDMFEVTFNANGYTSESAVYNYVKRRCAELTLEQGYTHYVILAQRESTEVNATTNALSGQTSIYEKPSNRVTIKLLKDPNPEMIAYDAAMILGKTKSDKLPAWND